MRCCFQNVFKIDVHTGFFSIFPVSRVSNHGVLTRFYLNFNFSRQLKSLFIFSVLTSFYLNLIFPVKSKVCLFSAFDEFFSQF